MRECCFILSAPRSYFLAYLFDSQIAQDHCVVLVLLASKARGQIHDYVIALFAVG